MGSESNYDHGRHYEYYFLFVLTSSVQLRCLQTQQAKTGPRDYALERLQARAGGRQSSGPDPRRSSLASFPGDGEDRRSRDRETPGSTSGISIRRQRTFSTMCLYMQILKELFSCTLEPGQ